MPKSTVNHIGIATRSLDDAEQIWSALGFKFLRNEESKSEGVKIRYMAGQSGTRIELLQPMDEDSPVGRFISKKGVGIQQIAIDVDDIQLMIQRLSEAGFRMINDKPLTSEDGKKIAFVHPNSCGGVLVELIERASDNHQKGSATR